MILEKLTDQVVVCGLRAANRRQSKSFKRATLS